ncbi:hypothetical protein FRUB_04781 [Fimbriiglobus ruber]|uniref:Uncharacterized protein n=1 Tax=Fimbriiglobus ruber TaxID=1908690 RepID=A0A225DUS0_9BACT|nr:hypothetical protein FRUB_04781 [Fimbriiglobus ruber]
MVGFGHNTQWQPGSPVVCDPEAMRTCKSHSRLMFMTDHHMRQNGIPV